MYQNREQNPQGGGRLNSPKNAVWQNFLSLRGSVATAAISKSFAREYNTYHNFLNLSLLSKETLHNVQSEQYNLARDCRATLAMTRGSVKSYKYSEQGLDKKNQEIVPVITRERSDRGNLFNLQLFAEKEENKTSKSKRLHLVTSLILILILALSMLPVMLISKNTNAYKSSTTTYVKVGELWNSNAKMFNNTNLNTLLIYLSSSGTIDGVNASNVDAGTIRGYTYNNKTNSQSIVVTLGGLEWQVVYLTTHKSTGAKVATLLLNDTTDTSVWGKHSSSSVGSYPANMYGTSYMRAVTLNNGGQYATSNSALSSSASQSSSNKYAKFTMSTYGLTSHLVQPKYIGYQTTSQGSSYNGTGYRLNNEAIGIGGGYSGYNYSDKTNYNKWGDDYVWLPSRSELGYEDAHPGIWNLSVNERAISGTYSWSRSSSSSSSYGAYDVDPSGSSSNSRFVNDSFAVRPALHLNLKSAVSYATLQVSVSSSNSSQGTVTSSGAYTGTYYRNGDLATITATPKSGYIFDYWTVGGTRVNFNPHSFEVTKDTTCVAYFKQGCTVTLNTNNDSYGTVYGAGTYESGTAVTLSAYPKTGYAFEYWEDSGGNKITSQTLTLTVTGNLTYTAVFRASYGLTITSDTSINIDSCATGMFQTDYYIVPASGYYIYSVQVADKPAQIMQYRSGILDYSSTSANIHYEINEDGTILHLSVVYPRANIAIKLVFANTAPTLKNNASAGGGPTGINVSATYGGTAGVVGDNFDDLADTDTIIFYATANQQGYVFEKWIDSNGNTLSTKASIRLTKKQAYDTKITAVFIQNTAGTNSSTDTGDHNFIG